MKIYNRHFFVILWGIPHFWNFALHFIERKKYIVQWSSETRSKLICWNWIKSMDYFHLCEVMVISLLSIKGIDTPGPSAFRGRKKWNHSMFTLAIPAYRQQSLGRSILLLASWMWSHFNDWQIANTWTKIWMKLKKCSYIICTYVFLFCQVIKSLILAARRNCLPSQPQCRALP